MTKKEKSDDKKKTKGKTKTLKPDEETAGDLILKLLSGGLRQDKKRSFEVASDEPVTKQELNVQWAVMSAIISELYLAVVGIKTDMQKRVSYRIRVGGEIDLFVTCDQDKADEMMGKLRKECTRLLKDIAPLAEYVGEVEETDDDSEEPEAWRKRGYG